MQRIHRMWKLKKNLQEEFKVQRVQTKQKRKNAREQRNQKMQRNRRIH